MTSEQVTKRSKRNSTARRDEERRFVAEQRFLRARDLNFSEIGRALGLSANTVRNVALGFHRNDRVMDALLAKWNEVVEDTHEYEFWHKEGWSKEGDAA
jgi:hypothetical protein